MEKENDFNKKYLRQRTLVLKNQIEELRNELKIELMNHRWNEFIETPDPDKENDFNRRYLRQRTLVLKNQIEELRNGLKIELMNRCGHEFIETPDPDHVFTKWICKNCKMMKSGVID